jgi:hypothetical protein
MSFIVNDLAPLGPSNFRMIGALAMVGALVGSMTDG